MLFFALVSFMRLPPSVLWGLLVDMGHPWLMLHKKILAFSWIQLLNCFLPHPWEEYIKWYTNTLSLLNIKSLSCVFIRNKNSFTSARLPEIYSDWLNPYFTRHFNFIGQITSYVGQKVNVSYFVCVRVVWWLVIAIKLFLWSVYWSFMELYGKDF